MDKLLVKTNREDIVTAARFFNKKQPESDIFYYTSKRNMEAAGEVNQNPFIEVLRDESKINATLPSLIIHTHIQINKIKEFSCTNEASIIIRYISSNSAELTKVKNCKTNLITRMPMTETITTIPMTHHCSGVSWSYKLCLTKTQLYL
ncbi:hypothetical protein AWN68_12895 [Roseivirga echinicomitans]|uniref:Uncharacterized protein n=1 Tax=Roseivirga echinicomitans TaxID=296218 RepID=A0A150XVF4_9BACT|nr:hypothetical protein AWN68_12895 [Roseivirga echinicomitans]